ncbi:MAG: gamma-glutamyltranspeptidase/glutathione hydrolase [Pseudohongiellaceae bacterium]|jgi:gamma-glutamyltranspeptidase/glutathione hydrolase
MKPFFYLRSSFLLLILSTPILAQQVTDLIAPEAGTSKQDKTSVKAQNYIAVTAHPLATQAAYDVLKQGGNAIDAMVTAQTVLGLVEPQSSGLGGGAFLVYYDAKSKRLTTFDGRETAPAKAPIDLFMADDQTPLDFFDAVVGGRSVGTPGTVKLLWNIHQKYGHLDWKKLLTPATSLANHGFEVSARLANAIKNDRTRLTSDATTASYFLPEGKALEAAQTLKNQAYADTLSLLAIKGGDYFYSADYSETITKKVQQSSNPGYLSTQDFEQYKVIERTPTCSRYREYNICGMGPPSSGAITVSQTLGMLENRDMSKMSPDNAKTWHIISEASRLAFADRGLYIADPDFVNLPSGLLSKSYLKNRAQLINENLSSKTISAGQPPALTAYQFRQGRSPEQDSTSHFVMVDREGNIVSMTSTIENGFGSRLMVNGFLLNNELTDFSFVPTENGKRIANSVEAGKRPRSSMAPTIVFKGDEPYLAIGSPGGSRIINYVSNSLIALLDWNYPLQAALDMPHIVNRFGTMDVEVNTKASGLVNDFKTLGYQISERDLNSGLHAVMFTKNGMIGAADNRREGTVLGD